MFSISCFSTVKGSFFRLFNKGDRTKWNLTSSVLVCLTRTEARRSLDSFDYGNDEGNILGDRKFC